VTIAAAQAQQVGDKLAGRVALVTGGTRGIGAAICASLLAQGAHVAAGYSSDAERAARFAAEQDGELTVHRGNVSVPDDCRRTLTEVIDTHGRLDILVNNAGIAVDRLVADLTDSDWDRVLAVNLSGAFHMAKAALPHMVARGSGRIINVSSIVAQMGNIGQANYAASKAGMLGLTKALAREAAHLVAANGTLTPDSIGLTVNAVTPGLVATEMLDAVPAKVLDRMVDHIPMRRIGRPEDIARVVHFLAADAASYVTGQVWAVNGGMDM